MWFVQKVISFKHKQYSQNTEIPSGGGQIMMGGGMWETRMQAMCKSLVYDHVIQSFFNFISVC